MFSASLRILFLFFVLPLVHATIFVTVPSSTTTCHGGQDCLVQWEDNGAAPFLSTIGPCFVGLYNGNGVLVQQIEPVDVSSVRSLNFTPDPSAGPDTHNYYINFTSVNVIGIPSSHYTQYSPSFALAGMSGSLQSPVPSDTSIPAVPSTVASAPQNSVTTTISVINSFSTSGGASSASAAPTVLTSSATASTPSVKSSAPSGSIAPSASPSSQSAVLSGSVSSGLSSTVSSTLSSSSASTISNSPVSAGSSTLTVPASFTTSRSPVSTPFSSSASASNSSSTATSATSGAVSSASAGFTSFTLFALLSPIITIASRLH
ncbi:hypothetical protein PHLGIDRAFT_28772 [Phlebiopsis gigantea 11061_1 CR5-6]|uniref:Uncharacterized protein n=1 Tax=Phlebiopsis gigantea (strain 11061_1 CR5-6) TaxID=745531 RepID=A0A0C3SDV0_PHLG1|nr:hypothetical protein PHLGIDRAFT_28772 [Phlebiopsis gigantea 11061_1 CR5-6]